MKVERVLRVRTSPDRDKKALNYNNNRSQQERDRSRIMANLLTDACGIRLLLFPDAVVLQLVQQRVGPEHLAADLLQEPLQGLVLQLAAARRGGVGEQPPGALDGCAERRHPAVDAVGDRLRPRPQLCAAADLRVHAQSVSRTREDS